MELIYGSEFSFVDGYAIKPFRTFVVNTNAPLHSTGFEVPSSGGIATFPNNPNYADRFILWRAIGQKLYLEERSLLYSINEGSICIDFSRTPIIPGTSITLFQENVLSILVPTATTIHRFYAKLTSPKAHDTFSILARIKEDEFIRQFHTYHILSNTGRLLRASCTHHPNRNTIAFCTAEGQLVVVQLNGFNDEAEKHEETVFGDRGFFDRFLGSPGSRSNLFSDACVVKNSKFTPETLTNQKKTAFAGITSDLVFAVTRDGWVQAWNVETKKQLPGTLHLKRPTDEGEDTTGYETNYIIRAYPVKKEILLAIGCDIMRDGKTVSTCVHLIKATTETLTHLSVHEKNLLTDERLIDISLIQLDVPNEEETDQSDQNNSLANMSIPSTAIPFNLTVMFKSPSAKKKYLLRRVSLAIEWNSATSYTQFSWHELKQFTSSTTSNFDEMAMEKKNSTGGIDEEVNSKPYNLSLDSSVETLMDAVFDTDLHSFDVVYRAVQIVTDNYRGACSPIRYNRWADLTKLIDSYLVSMEFNRKFQLKTERSIRLRLHPSQETQVVARKTFWWALLRACEELDFAARGAISLAPLELPGDLTLMTVIHRDRLTLLGDNDFNLFDIVCLVGEKPKVINEDLVDLIEKAAKIADYRIQMMNREKMRNANARNGSTQNEDEFVENGYDYEHDGQFLTINSLIDPSILRLASSFVETANYDNSLPFGSTSRCIFGGSFTQSLVAANIRVTVERRLHFALTLRALLNGISNQRSRAGSPAFGEIDSLKIELREIIRIYRELIEQLDLKVVKNGAKMSLGTWLTSDNEGLVMVRQEGGYGENEVITNEGNFNVFVGITTESAVRALLSTSEVLVLFKRLVAKKEYKILLTILNAYINETRALKPVISFYRGIAYSGTDHPFKALTAFKSALDAFIDGNVALRKTILFLLPRPITPVHNVAPIDQLGLPEYYLTVVRFLQEHGHTEEVVSVALTAIETLPVENDSVQLISNTLFNHLTARHEWYKALKLILSTFLGSATRRASICELLTLMMSQGEWEAIATMAYGAHEQVVEEFLRDAASRQSPTESKHIYELLFAYYVARKDYRMAACSMYEYARHIESAAQMTAGLLRRRRDALAAVLNMQAVLSIEPEEDEMVYDDHEDTNLVFPASACDDSDDEDGITEGSSSSPDGIVIGPKTGRQFGTVLARSHQHSHSHAHAGDGDRASSNNSSDYGSNSNSNSGSNTNSNSNSYTTSSSGESTQKKLQDLRQKSSTAYHGRADENDENMMQHDGSGQKSSISSNLRGRRKLLVLTENQIRDEWIVCAARVELLLSEAYEGIPPIDPKELVKALTDTWQFDCAFDVARQFTLNSERLFFCLVKEAIMIDSLEDGLDIEAAATQIGGWVRKNRRHCLTITTSDDHWAVVRGLIDAATIEWPNDSRPLRGAVEAFLTYNVTIPYWLHSIYEKHDANDYLRCLVDYENFSVALQVVIDLVEQESVKIPISGTKTWLPYGVIDEAMNLSGTYLKNIAGNTDDEKVQAAELFKLRKLTDEKLVAYFKKLESFEKAHKMSQKFL